ncbi:MAG: hypothetical protein RLZ12_302 [Bacillota bacterium]|jgi:hypothetical protein
MKLSRPVVADEQGVALLWVTLIFILLCTLSFWSCYQYQLYYTATLKMWEAKRVQYIEEAVVAFVQQQLARRNKLGSFQKIIKGVIVNATVIKKQALFELTTFATGRYNIVRKNKYLIPLDSKFKNCNNKNF